ncbi:secondary thiamine-phosphate synthase enzyme [Clostridium sp. USBA 49]|uniref:secondary thiamine-phosphate synthase enzyme YjbQ n=1 Tax=Clostridium sp. USBA 49 TaxID=1881060 RepID=UPI00099AD78B|nr:secondary thiamine-phosphate synthase enzyme YjbQ [Clostridium sp. USBA 49]SKA82841.1 secondary thiamine-phosphate synthase enzyme [Clostridium sp. USBA 49]
MEHKIRTTKSQEFVDITNIVKNEVIKSNVKDGIAVIFIPHTTAAVTINENTDPNVVFDILSDLSEVFPKKSSHKHFEGNSHAHIKASLLGASESIIIENGSLKLGTWQGIYFCEFDGPRNRKIYIKIIENNKN